MSALNTCNTFDGLDEPVRPTPGGRKRRLDKGNHKKQQKKKVRHSGGALIPTVGCQHKAAAKDFCQTERLSPDDLICKFQLFLWKTKQDWPGPGHTSSPGHHASDKEASESPGH